MAKKKRGSVKRLFSWIKSGNISPETKHSLAVIFILLLSILMILGLFDLAGIVGVYLLRGLKYFFGKGFAVFPFILFLIGIILIDRQRFGFKPTNFIGIILLGLSIQGLLHWRGDYQLMSANSLSAAQGGGYVGWFIATPLYKIFGFWAGLAVLIAILLAGLFLTFNSSFSSWLSKVDNLRLWRERFGSWWFHLRHKDEYQADDSEDEEDTEDTEEDNDQEEEIEKDENVESPSFSSRQIETDGQQAAMPLAEKNKSVKIELPIDLLSPSRSKPTSGDIHANKEKIKKALQNFGIDVEMGEVSIGPTVTQYTLRPQEGVKLSSITALHNDLALALAAHPIRIEAPIPGKALVGIEVPNQSIATVGLREIISARDFKSATSPLTMGLGKDVAGKVWTTPLDRMPHLLIAGATGSGKSVCINTIIVSLLYQNNPEDLKFILVDPKRVELSSYNDLPYLLTPVITDVTKTINALKWAVEEMDKRYVALSQTKHKNLVSYNQAFPQSKLPYIVIIIDELADLMSVAAQEVEAAIIRLAQMARAVGIHLILATQRPSVNVITGLIKANITSRIAFAVASQMDSRTILDTSGAEKLLGRGDMLFISAEISKPKRLQSAFVSDEEIGRITTFIKNKSQGDVSFDDSITEKKSGKTGVLGQAGNEEDELFTEAKELIIQTQKASASYLQRRLRVGYARAARLLDLLEDAGIVGPADGAKPREVLISKEEYRAEQEEEEDFQGSVAEEDSLEVEENEENNYY